MHRHSWARILNRFQMIMNNNQANFCCRVQMEACTCLGDGWGRWRRLRCFWSSLVAPCFDSQPVPTRLSRQHRISDAQPTSEYNNHSTDVIYSRKKIVVISWRQIRFILETIINLDKTIRPTLTVKIVAVNLVHTQQEQESMRSKHRWVGEGFVMPGKQNLEVLELANKS